LRTWSGGQERAAELALEIDRAMREHAPAGWKDEPDGPRGKQVLNCLVPDSLAQSRVTQAVFEILKHQPGY
jgi:type I restriction enzyme R subunit